MMCVMSHNVWDIRDSCDLWLREGVDGIVGCGEEAPERVSLHLACGEVVFN